MAIAYRSVTSVTSATRTTTTVNMPAGATAGDEIRIFVGAGVGSSTATTITPPGSVTYVTTVTYGAPDPWTVRVSEYRYRVVGSGDPTSFAFTTPSASTEALAVAFSGVDATTPDDATSTTNPGAAWGTTATFTGLTVATTGAALVGARGSWDGTAITAPTGWTEVVDQPVTWLGYKLGLATGATGAITLPSGNGGTFPWATIMSVLRPASGSSPVTATPTGIASALAFGAVTVALTLGVALTGIPTAEAFGTPTATATLTASPSGIGTGETFGTPTISATLTSTPTGISTGEAFGTVTIAAAGSVSPTGIASAETFGAPVVSTRLTAVPTGVPSAAAVGTPTVTATLTASPTGIGTSEAVGVPAVSFTVTASPVGIGSSEAFGTPVAFHVLPYLPDLRRTMPIPAETRRVTITAETRTLLIPAESRTLEAPCP